MAEPFRIRPSKRLGQNFLADHRVASRVVSVAELDSTDVVLEPGSGYGTLTRLLEKKAGHVIAVEKDYRLASNLQREFGKSSTVSIIEGDVLKVQLPPFNKIVGTPPYTLSSKLILFLTKNKFDLASLVFQKEFGERLLAKPGTPGYGRLSITAQRSLTIEPITNVSSRAFRPRPMVDSILLRISPRKTSDNVDEKMFEELVRGLFNQRRRLVRSSLLHFLSKEHERGRALAIFKKVNVPEKRVYELTIEDLEDLCRQLAGPLGNDGWLA